MFSALLLDPATSSSRLGSAIMLLLPEYAGDLFGAKLLISLMSSKIFYTPASFWASMGGSLVLRFGIISFFSKSLGWFSALSVSNPLSSRGACTISVLAGGDFLFPMYEAEVFASILLVSVRLVSIWVWSILLSSSLSMRLLKIRNLAPATGLLLVAPRFAFNLFAPPLLAPAKLLPVALHRIISA